MKYVLTGILLFAGMTLQAQDALRESIARGKTLYDANCLACHQMDGSGVPGLAPALAGNKHVEEDAKKLILVVLKGMEGELEVNGNYFNSVMPPQPHLSDNEIADILTYMRNSWTNKADPVKPETVKEVRASLKN